MDTSCSHGEIVLHLNRPSYACPDLQGKLCSQPPLFRQRIYGSMASRFVSTEIFMSLRIEMIP